MSLAASQLDLITDDPRVSGISGAIAEFRAFYQASRELHGLLTQSQAAKILDVDSSQVCTWVRKGRLSSRVVCDVRMVSAGEVLALHKERELDGPRGGGRGRKAPSLSDLSAAAYEDVFKD